MKLLILTQYYPPEHGAPQNRLHDLARRWALDGHHVTVMTAMPNYPRGEVFPNYRGRFKCVEEIDGVRVVRSAIFATRNKGTIAQLTSYFSFVFSSILVGAFGLGRHDFLICESPPLFLGFTALILRYLTRSKLVMNISDLWPESAVQLGVLKPGMALSALEWFEGLLYKFSVFVSCQTEGIAAGVRTRSRATETFLFPNGVDLEMFNPSPRNSELAASLGLPDDAFIVGYGGNHGRSQALRQVLDAAEIVKEQSKHRVLFALFGDGPEKDELIAESKRRGLDEVLFFPSQPRDKMSAIQGLWDVALVPLKDIALFDGARPSKMFELMAVGVPFIFCGKGEGADIAKASGCAKITPPEDPGALTAAVLKLVDLSLGERASMGKAGRTFVAEHFDRAELARRFMEKLSSFQSDNSEIARA